MGCSLAFYLTRQGRSVIVIDRGRIGQGATAACAGGIRAQFSTEVNIRMGMEAKRLLSRFADETGASADFRQVGYLFLLTTHEERESFSEAVRLQRRLGLNAKADRILHGDVHRAAQRQRAGHSAQWPAGLAGRCADGTE